MGIPFQSSRWYLESGMRELLEHGSFSCVSVEGRFESLGRAMYLAADERFNCHGPALLFRQHFFSVSA
jgi:hypothetical protein